MYSFVVNPFVPEASIDWDKLYEVFYEQHRLGDNLIDLEIEYINRIINKIKNDPEPNDIKKIELNLWSKIKEQAGSGRRIGAGITALADMIAAMNLKYDSEESLVLIERIMKTKLEAELEANIDLAIFRGCFKGFDRETCFSFYESEYGLTIEEGRNSFYEMILNEFPELAIKINNFGMRNVSWSTIAPTGSVSILTQTSSGCEPVFMPYYMRRKKINPNDENVRIDFKDQNGDCWQEFAVVHPKLKRWIETVVYRSENEMLFEDWLAIQPKDFIQLCFEKSPYYQATANDINWHKRVQIQKILQRYTTNAISSTLNLPSTVSKEEVSDIYMLSWENGLKGQTMNVRRFIQ